MRMKKIALSLRTYFLRSGFWAILIDDIILVIHSRDLKNNCQILDKMAQ